LFATRWQLRASTRVCVCLLCVFCVCVCARAARARVQMHTHSMQSAHCMCRLHTVRSVEWVDVRTCPSTLKHARGRAGCVVGISFDATCSLVVLGHEDAPVTVSTTGEPHRNIIQWRDHRAMEQATRVNNGAHRMLDYVGGVVSPEHEVPKLMWLKETLPASWDAAVKVMDLADFMVYTASGVDCRSLCTSVCKWSYLGHKASWDSAFFDLVGLGDLLPRKMVPDDIRPMGACAGPLTEAAAAHLGLSSRTVVGVGIIDAHAGALGVGVSSTNMALILGTSACHMLCSPQATLVPGVWGPYYGAQREGEWLIEGGLSASGSLMDHIILRYGHVRGECGLRHVLDLEDGELGRAHLRVCVYIYTHAHTHTHAHTYTHTHTHTHIHTHTHTHT
jgi:FGGY-family pentulose kinase